MNIPISNLPSITTLKNGDYLMISEKKSDNVYSSRKIQYLNVVNENNEKIRLLKNISIEGNWIFTNKQAIEIETNSISASNSVINIEYLENAFNPIFEKLYDSLYSAKNIIPSYVGEIIFSKTLKTESEVQKRYGINTNWEQIPGRFIFGQSNSDDKFNTPGRMGGKINGEITTAEIPNHQHNFERDNSISKKISKTVSYNTSAMGGKRILCVWTQNGNYPPGNGLAYSAAPGVFRVDSEAVEEDGEKLYGNKSDANVTIKPNSSKSDIAINNMPPFISVFIWRRIK